MGYKHNYVIVGADGYYLVGYHDLMTLNNVRYFSGIYDGITSELDKKMIRFTFSKKVNKIFQNPLSFYTYPRLFPFQFEDDKPLVFLFFGNTQYVYQSTYLKYLRKNYSNVKLVLYMQDVIARNFDLDFEKVRNCFDLILSYDKGDCKKYGLLYYPTPYSIYPIENDELIEPLDVFYCGHAKSRYNQIFDVYHRCKEKGLKVKFFITAVPNDKKIICDDIIYDKPISYIENLQYVQKSKCILEIMQDNTDGYTPRLWESIIYDKHLLTNNTFLQKSRFYQVQSMHHADDIENILSWINNPISNSEELKISLSPKELLKCIDTSII